MTFLLDTNVVSEWTKPNPEPSVDAWLSETDEDRMFLSVITLAELRHGIERLPSGARRRRLGIWLEDQLAARFELRLLPVDSETADIVGRMMARVQAKGRTIGTMDTIIAATAQQHGLTVVTRDVADFATLEASIFNPWSMPAE